MTNQEAKQKAIREAYYKAGLVWDEISKYVGESGEIVLPDPELARDLTGLGAAMSRRDLLAIVKTKHGIWMHLLSIAGISINNGWTRIDGPNTLPPTRGKYTVLGKSGKIEEWTFTGLPNSCDFWLEYFTHWRLITELPKPIY